MERQEMVEIIDKIKETEDVDAKTLLLIRLAGYDIPTHAVADLMTFLEELWDQRSTTPEMREVIMQMAIKHVEVGVSHCSNLIVSFGQKTLEWCLAPPTMVSTEEVKNLVLEFSAAAFAAQQANVWFKVGEVVEVYNESLKCFDKAEILEVMKGLDCRVKFLNIEKFEKVSKRAVAAVKPIRRPTKFKENKEVDVSHGGAWFRGKMLSQNGSKITVECSFGEKECLLNELRIHQSLEERRKD